MLRNTAVRADGTVARSIGLPPLNSPASLDFETTGRQVYSTGFAPRLCQISLDGEVATCIDARRHDLIRHIVRTVPQLIVHNASYDLAILDRYFDIPLEETWSRTTDTQELSRLLYPTESEKLKDNARRFLDADVDSDKALREEFKALKLRPIETGYAEIPLTNETFLRYAGLDALYTWRLWRLWRERVDPDMLAREHRLQYHTAAMTRRGIKCDREETERQIKLLDRGIAERAARLDESGIPQNIATDEGRSALEAFLKKSGASLTYTPKSEKLSIKSDELQLAVIDATDEAKQVVEDLAFIRHAEKATASYLNAFLVSSERDGYVRPTVRTMAARTHRMSVSEPPLQQIPSKPLVVGDEEADPRGCLIARPGHVLVGADFSQIENRIVATLAKEESLIKDIKDGIDTHRATAASMYDVDINEVTDEQRSYAKTASYATLYGSGAKTLSMSANITVGQAREVIKRYKQAYPAIAAYAETLAHCQEVRTPYGRVLPVDPTRRYASLNYMVQSTARDAMVDGLMNLVKAGYGPNLWLVIHDEILMEVPEDKAEQAAADMTRLMTLDFYGTPLDAEGEIIGKRWRVHG